MMEITHNYFNGIIYHHEINYEIIEMEEGLFDTISKINIQKYRIIFLLREIK